MCAQKESRPGANPEGAAKDEAVEKGAESEKWIQFTSEGAILFLIKAADSQHRPKGNYFGKAEFERAPRGASGERYLLHILVPNHLRDLSIRYAAGGESTALEELRMVFRMPDSPLHTFVMVEAGALGRLEMLREGRIVEILNLADVSEALEDLPLHWNRKTETVSFQGLPATLNGRMPD